MNRNEIILQQIDRRGAGLEIGAGYNPVAPKCDGYKVHILDHLNREQLREKFRNEPVNPDRIEEVDFIWSGESYRELTRQSEYYDWIIASHVIEHVPDLVGFLNECDSILKPGGVLSLAIPDARFCFDHFRMISGLSQAVNAHILQAKTHLPGTAVDHVLNYATLDGNIAWDDQTRGDFKFHHSAGEAREYIDRIMNENAYFDFHAWCFTPHSFRLMVSDLYDLGLIRLREVSFPPGLGCEFYAVLSRHGSGSGLNRANIIRRIRQEISNTEPPEKGPSEIEPPTGFLQRCRNFLSTGYT